jgi:hypothetical protein
MHATVTKGALVTLLAYSPNIAEKLSKKSGKLKTNAYNATKRSKEGSFHCDMTALFAVEIPPSEFLDSFRRGILGSS